jgi:hypothetical protein
MEEGEVVVAVEVEAWKAVHFQNWKQEERVGEGEVAEGSEEE